MTVLALPLLALALPLPLLALALPLPQSLLL
jgi:hypothetical protein